MANITTEIKQWANTLPFWEQAALDKVLSGVQLSESDYDALLQYLLEDVSLEKPVSKRPELQFSDTISKVAQSSSGNIRLERIFT